MCGAPTKIGTLFYWSRPAFKKANYFSAGPRPEAQARPPGGPEPLPVKRSPKVVRP